MSTAQNAYREKGSLQIEMGFDFIYARGRQAEYPRNTGYVGNGFQVRVNFFHGRRDKGEPDIKVIVSEIIMRDAGIPVDRFSEQFDFFIRNPGCAQGTDITELLRDEITADSPDNPGFPQTGESVQYLGFTDSQFFSHFKVRS